MRVFGLATGADTAGIVGGITFAFRRHAPDYEVHSIVASGNYIGYPVDTEAQPDREAVSVLPYATRYHMAVERLYDAADVVMLHNTLHAHRWYDNGQGKPTVLMHHGLKNGSERPFPVMVRDARAIGAVQVASTLDLALLEPDVTWLPAPADLEAMRRIRAERYRPGKVLRVGHAPTDRAIKGSDAFDAAIATLQVAGLAVEPVVISKMPWQDCLALKATCDLFFDQPVLGYGSNAVEAWAMGIPVISGVADPGIREGMIARWGVLPFMEASEATLAWALRAMVGDPDLRAEYAARGTAHVTRWHDERVTVDTLKALYPTVPRSRPGGSERRYSKAVLSKVARYEARDRAAVAV